MDPCAGKSRSISAVLFGAMLLVAALIGTETALGLVFDPRYRDFPFAALTMAVVPFASVMVLNRPRSVHAQSRKRYLRPCLSRRRSISA